MKKETKEQILQMIFAVLVLLSFTVFPDFFQKDNINPSKGQKGDFTRISIGQNTLKAFRADNSALRQKGLGGREAILSDEGMLFAFDTSDYHGIWMKDMMFPLDIIWMDEWKPRTDADKTQKNAEGKSRLVVVDVKENVSPATFPEVFTPKSPASYVLETRAGFARENGVKIGEEISF